MIKQTNPNKNMSANGAFRIMLTGFVVMLFAALFCAVYFSIKMKEVSKADTRTYESYDRHYVFITDNAEQEFWNEVYAAAVEEGERSNAYVERLGENLNVNYQAAVDYNRVGEVKILGYYSTDAILDAVEKQIIYSTVQVDTEEIGSQCIKALTEYYESGYTSSYIPIDTQVIGREEAQALLQEAEVENAGS